MTIRLLNDEELKNKILSSVVNIIEVHSEHETSWANKVAFEIEYILTLVQGQKKAHADMVIGDDNEYVACDDLHPDAYTIQPRVKSAQRARNK